MAKGFKKTKKVPFSELPESFKDAMVSSSPEELQKQLADIHKDDERNLAAKKADQDLKEKQEQVKVAAQGYNDVTKLNKLKTAFIIQLLADRGEELSSEIVRLKLDGK
jgi:hypothetical protein